MEAEDFLKLFKWGLSVLLIIFAIRNMIENNYDRATLDLVIILLLDKD